MWRNLSKFQERKRIHLNLYMDDKLYIEHGETEEGEKYSESVEIPYYVRNFDEFISKIFYKGIIYRRKFDFTGIKKELEENCRILILYFQKPHYLECLNKEVGIKGWQ